MEVLKKPKLISGPVDPILFSGIDTWVKLKINNFTENKKKYPWHLCIEVELKFQSFHLAAFHDEIKLHENIDQLLNLGVKEKVDSVKLFSVIENKVIKHYWQLAKPLKSLTFAEILILDELNKLKPLTYTMCEDKDWRLATTKIERLKNRSKILL